ncbi:alkaline phosphatase D family protein [Kineosporia mesophila]|uniref:Alkaline phosphatase D family protein n=1 Tax=Kineosporia mesophila TaxID=566012 RepID=A0ABP7AEC6_9ACTN|nr:alkaline phosphatase D family protein [Kineosporia mesophila]MCD5352857.1 alkaline phosphatase D family protein [Kineosporia mesophila]
MPNHFSRRGVLRGAAGVAGLAATSGFASPSLITRNRAALTHGVQSGDVTADSAVVWTRSDRPARMFVQVSPTGRFAEHSRTYRGPVLTAKSDFTGRVDLTGLPAGEDVTYRVVLGEPDSHRAVGQHVDGLLHTAPRRSRDVRFLWSGDQAGQGWGRNPDLGGFPIYRAMRQRNANFFLHSGDSVYADGPITGDVTLPDGRIYRNELEEAKSHVAETLDDFRGAHRYNLGDAGMRAFLAHTPLVCQWDDHEVSNNWYPGEILDDARYTEKSIDVLKRRAYQAWTEYQPLSSKTVKEHQIYRKVSYGPTLDIFILDMRTYRNANTPGRESGGISADGGILGGEQARWLVRELQASKATWKVIQSDMPIGLVVPDGTDIEAVAQGTAGAPLGRERQIAWILREIKRRKIANTVWLTADVHYTAAHHYDPSRAGFTDFDPFWEFVSGPLHAGAFGPNALDSTFGPQQVFAATPPRANTSPLEGSQFFGEVEIDGDSKDFTVHLRDIEGKSLWSQTLKDAKR